LHILIVEDEPKILEVLIVYFEKEGWTTDHTGDGYEALNRMKQFKYDFIILDLMIYGISGEEVCRKIRAESDVPIIMISSKAREDDSINGLNLGADDYITKPFYAKQVVARIYALQRRINSIKGEQLTSKIVAFNKGRLEIDYGSREVKAMSRPVSLTKTEFDLLSVLAEKPGKVFSRNELSYEVYKYRGNGDVRSIDAHIKNVRKKIELDPKEPIYILTLFGLGYKFAFQPDARV
jgi:DNA-binding response OmpR family regulator